MTATEETITAAAQHARAEYDIRVNACRPHYPAEELPGKGAGDVISIAVGRIASPMASGNRYMALISFTGDLLRGREKDVSGLVAMQREMTPEPEFRAGLARDARAIARVCELADRDLGDEGRVIAGLRRYADELTAED